MTQDKHSPLPWKTRKPPESNGYTYIEPVDDENLAIVVYNRDDDAAFIVRACNNHYQLVEALEAFVSAYDNERWPIENDIGLFEDARQALSNAKGGKDE